MTTKDMDLDCYGINLETADNEAFKKMITDELKSKIDTLQRWDFFHKDFKTPFLNENPNGRYVVYDDLKKLLED